MGVFETFEDLTDENDKLRQFVEYVMSNSFNGIGS